MNAFEKHMAALQAGPLNRRDWHRLALAAAMTPWLGACAQAQAVGSSAEAALVCSAIAAFCCIA